MDRRQRCRRRSCGSSGALLEVGSKLRAGDAHRAERVVVRVERREARDRDRSRGERRVERERGGRRELRARRFALDLENEVDERRVDDPRRIGAPGHGRRADGRGDVLNGDAMPFLRDRQHLRILLVVRRRHDLTSLRHDLIAAVAPLESQVRDGDARRPVLRLHEQRPADDRVGHLLVRVPVDDQIDARHLVRDSRRDVLTRHARCSRCRSSTAR